MVDNISQTWPIWSFEQVNDFWTAIILGIVEGITEFLPVSSTGHLILATEALGYNAEKWALFNVAIQPGAILAIVVLYWRTFMTMMSGLLRFDASAIRFVRNLLIAFFPAVVLGLLFGKQIDALLGNGQVVAWALIVGGVAILVVEYFARPTESGGVAEVGIGRSIAIGLAQCLAIVPGVSRSGATILGAMSFGVDRKTAAEFSFFLAVPTLTGATVLQLAKHHDELTGHGLGLIAVGFVVSFLVAMVVVKAFVAAISRFGFAPFAWYRIIAGVTALILLTH
jgi:undecaprenyl-diphosphatase